MANARQCQRCGKPVPTERELDPVHRCPHGFMCTFFLYDKCVQCWEASEKRKAAIEARKADLAAKVKATLPAGRKVLMAERGGIPDGIAAGPAGVVAGVVRGAKC